MKYAGESTVYNLLREVVRAHPRDGRVRRLAIAYAKTMTARDALLATKDCRSSYVHEGRKRRYMAIYHLLTGTECKASQRKGK